MKKKITLLANIPVRVSAHRTLNSCRGFISESYLQYVPETKILENLKGQNVTDVLRIAMHKNNTKVPTRQLILTINSPKLPQSIKTGYPQCANRPYIPNPLSFLKCQRFGYSKTSCRGNPYLRLL